MLMVLVKWLDGCHTKIKMNHLYILNMFIASKKTFAIVYKDKAIGSFYNNRRILRKGTS